MENIETTLIAAYNATRDELRNVINDKEAPDHESLVELTKLLAGLKKSLDKVRVLM